MTIRILNNQGLLWITDAPDVRTMMSTPCRAVQYAPFDVESTFWWTPDDSSSCASLEEALEAVWPGEA